MSSSAQRQLLKSQVVGVEMTNAKTPTNVNICQSFKGVMTRLMVDTLSELCSPFFKGGNSACFAAIASGLFPQT